MRFHKDYVVKYYTINPLPCLSLYREDKRLEKRRGKPYYVSLHFHCQLIIPYNKKRIKKVPEEYCDARIVQVVKR